MYINIPLIHLIPHNFTSNGEITCSVPRFSFLHPLYTHAFFQITLSLPSTLKSQPSSQVCLSQFTLSLIPPQILHFHSIPSPIRIDYQPTVLSFSAPSESTNTRQNQLRQPSRAQLLRGSLFRIGVRQLGRSEAYIREWDCFW